ncbi:MAG: bifunctional diaminohydroxyphosphoribosylaminopyrimidine deaminase/5-amino-6-(5-phosphoribosylamino)uracil reductase RibD, partial [Thermoanaerobaculia bacterium]
MKLAARGRATVAPNPMVGAVVVRDGRVVGEGFHRRPGEPHAEVLALAAAGHMARGATLFVNLEPCSHHGRTPPCAEALVDAGIARVVVCHRDPDPRVSGRGFSRLQAAGIAVEVGELAEAAIELNFRFLVQRIFGRPQVTLKWAMSLDGKIATVAGESQWISGTAARRWALALREEHDAILVGSGTVLADDPRLDRRLGRADAPILRVVLDRRLRTPPTARLFSVPGPVKIYSEAVDGEAAQRLRDRGAEVVVLATVSPASVVADLGA